MAARVQRLNPETGTCVLTEVGSGTMLQERRGVYKPGKPLGQNDYGYCAFATAGFRSPCNSLGSGRLEHCRCTLRA